MLGKLRSRLTYGNVMSTIAVFGVLAGGTAYAANTVFSSDIADNQVYSADVRDDNLSGGGLTASDLANGSITTGEVRDDTQFPYGLYSQDLAADSVKSSEIADGAVGSSEVQNNSLTGTDINETTLGQVPSAANGAYRLFYDDPATADIKTVVAIREMTLRVDCVDDDHGGLYEVLYVDSTVPAGVDYEYVNRTNDSGNTVPTAGGGLTNFTHYLAQAFSGDFTRAEGQLIYSNANRMISVSFHAVANQATRRCLLYGTAVPAPG